MRKLVEKIGNSKRFQTPAFLRPLAHLNWQMPTIGPPSPLKMADVLYGWPFASNFALQNVHRKPTTIWRISLKFNTKFLRNLTMVYLVKTEYGWNFWIKVLFTLRHKYIYHKVIFWIPSIRKEDHFCNWIFDFVEKASFLWSKMS